MKHRFWILLSIVLLAATVRLSQSHRFFYYDGDQSKDVDAVRELYQTLRTGRWDKLSSVGQEGIFYYLHGFPQPEGQPNVVYNGISYYYFLLPAGIASGFRPYGFILFLTFLSLAATWAIYYAGRFVADEATGIIAALLHAASFVLLIYTRIIWTPSPLPSLSVFAFASFFAILRGHQVLWPVLALCVSLATQMHNSGYLMLGFFLTMGMVFRPKFPTDWRVRLGTLIVFIIPFLPTLINESGTGFLLLRAIGYQIFVHLAGLYARSPVWLIPFVLIRDIGVAFFQFLGMVLFVGDLAREFPREFRTLILAQIIVWITALIVARPAIRIPRWALPVLIWTAGGSFIAKLYYRTDLAIFWLNGVSAFVPLMLLITALPLRFAWTHKQLRVPVVLTLASFGFLQGMATTFTFWANTKSDIMYAHQARALHAITNDTSGRPYGLYVDVASVSVPSLAAISQLEKLPPPAFVQGGQTCQPMTPLTPPHLTYTMVMFPEDQSIETQWVMRHSGKLIFDERIAVYRRQ